MVLPISSVTGFNRNVRSCSNDLKTAFHSLIRGVQVIVAVPKAERNMHVLTIPEVMNQPCNQESFYENLVHNTLLNRKLHRPSFRIKPFYQSPQDRCRIYYRQSVNLGISNTLSHRTDIQNSVFETYLLFSSIGAEIKITSLMEEPNTILIFPRDADTILFTFYILNSFFERHTSITHQLHTKPANPRLQESIKPCYIELHDLPLLKSVRYLNASSNVDANNIVECNLQLWTTVEVLAPNLIEVKFPSGKLTPFAPRNLQNDRIYYRRRKTTTADQESPPFWFVLQIHMGDPLLSIRKSLWLLHWANTHISDHKHLFAPPSLQPQHTSKHWLYK